MVDEAPVLLLAGLGNPGPKYQRTWHNLGYMALDVWASRYGLTFKPGRGDYTYLEYRSYRGVITFLKPTPFMNLSGVPIAEIARYKKIPPESTLVVCDDVALPLGHLRIRKVGSSGGHKGLESVILHQQTEEIPRVRLGIFTQGWPGSLKNYVLSKIPDDLIPDLEKLLAVSADALDCIINEGVTTAMNKYNRNWLLNGSDIDISSDSD